MSDPTDPCFERSIAELERIIRDLEDGETGLEEALARYEAGVGLLRRCYAQLKDAEQRIVLLSGLDGDGRPLTRPFEHAPSADAASSPKLFG